LASIDISEHNSFPKHVNEHLVQIHHLSKSFAGRKALRDCQLEVAEGDFIGIIGPSGCGKSTLLRLLAGLEKPTEGTLTLDGAPPQAGRDDLAYIFQDPTLLPWRTARRNIELPLEVKGASRPDRKRKADELLAMVGLSADAEKFPRELSGGMQMRVSIARALALEPRILLLDEPFAALDAMTRNRLNGELLTLRQRKPFTAFFVTHSVTEAVFLSSRILVMSPQPGRVAAIEEIPLAYPREDALRLDKVYQEAVARVTAELLAVEGGAV